jgi:hypothetical protein
MVNKPLPSEEVPLDGFPFSITEAPEMGPDASDTTPVIVLTCACNADITRHCKKSK